MSEGSENPRPLDGIRVLEMGQLIAGPFAGCVLAYFGAEVIKVEAPGRGDPLRTWRVMRNGTSLWWRSMARNKHSITLDLRSGKGREVALRLADRADVLIENFRPGTMEKWGLGPDALRLRNPDLVYARVSGYGQTGPYSSRPGFASVCEGIGGFRYVNGFPGEVPVRPNLSLGDTLAGLQAVIGVLLALVKRGRGAGGQSEGAGTSPRPGERGAGGRGELVDVAIYEAVFNLMEAVVPEYDGAGVVREPSGSTLTGIVPTNNYRCRDDRHVIIGGNHDAIFRRLMGVIGREDLGEDPRLRDNRGRVAHQEEVDGVIAGWTAQHDSGAVLEALERASVPAGPIYSVVDMMRDPHFQARGLFETVEVEGERLKIPAITPRLAEHPGATDWAGPELGEHNDAIYRDLLGLPPEEIRALREEGVI